MDEAMDVPPKPVRQEESRRDRRGAEDKRRERDATERRFEKEERAPRRTHARSSQERLGVAGDRKERDREYKRRQSPSPPPANNKDRRHSPSSRRSPPCKRRRDVAFEGSRRKSFGEEGGHGFANDNRIGGFDGVRLYLPKRMEDQNKLDCANFQGFTMNSYTTITYGNSHTSQRESLMTYKQFILELEDDISPKDAQCRYEAYKKDYITTKKRAYFKKYKNNDWLRDRYDPTRLEALLIRRNEDAKIQAKEFLSELQTFLLCLSAKVQSLAKDDQDSNMEYGTKWIKLSQPQSLTQEDNDSLLVHSKCSVLKRMSNDIDIERSLIKKLDGEKGIEENILLLGKDFKVDMIGEDPLVILRSCKHVKELVGIEHLEIMRKYLWCVHFVDYYGMIEYKEKPRKNQLKDPPKVEINENGLEDATFVEWEKKLETTWQKRLQTGDLIESMLGKDILQVTISDALDPFVRKIRDEKYGWKYGCSVKGCTKLFHGAEFVHKHLKLKHPDLITKVITKAQEKLYFQNYMSDVDAPRTSHKASIHLRHSHRSHDESKKIHQQSISKTPIRCIDKQECIDKYASSEKIHPPSDTKNNPYPTQKCVRILENEHFNCNGQKEKLQFDLLEVPQHSPPPQIFPILGNVRPNISQRRLMGDCFEHLPMDPFVFDHFNGQPLQGLSSNMHMHDIPCPPQVLMPIPGAGPLGPFVLAPSRIAMKFLIEVPDPFHHGLDYEVFNNKERPCTNFKIPTSTPLLESGLLNISSLMIPPHILNQDPRSIRSYHDLDKPEDDVAVIDYRTL